MAVNGNTIPNEEFPGRSQQRPARTTYLQMSWIATGVVAALPSAREKQWRHLRITRFDEMVDFRLGFLFANGLLLGR